MAALGEQALRDENMALRVKNVPGKTAPMGRRALGDIGNLVGPYDGAQHGGKAIPAKKVVDATMVEGRVTRNRAQKEKIELLPGTEEQQRAKGKSWTQCLGDRAEQVSAERPAQLAQCPPAPLPDIDVDDKANPLAATEYANDIIRYFKRVEAQYRVEPDYMSQQTDINDKMRAILIDWLVEVHHKFKLMPETLFLTINLIDRFLATKQVTRRNLQLVGVTAMLIASKYEEIWAPEVRDYVYISDKAYTKEQILSMEKVMLNALQFKLTVPTPFVFLGRYQKANKTHTDKDFCNYAQYLVELALPEYSSLKYTCSLLAAAAVYATNVAFGRTPAFPYEVAKHSSLDEGTVRACAIELARMARKAPNSSLCAVFKKFSSTKYGAVAGRAAPVGLLSDA